MEVKPRIYKVESLTVPVTAIMIRLEPHDLLQIASAKNLNVYKCKGSYYLVDGNVVFVCHEELFDFKRK